jgi:hypothetical protein
VREGVCLHNFRATSGSLLHNQHVASGLDMLLASLFLQALNFTLPRNLLHATTAFSVPAYQIDNSCQCMLHVTRNICTCPAGMSIEILWRCSCSASQAEALILQIHTVVDFLALFARVTHCLTVTVEHCCHQNRILSHISAKQCMHTLLMVNIAAHVVTAVKAMSTGQCTSLSRHECVLQ